MRKILAGSLVTLVILQGAPAVAGVETTRRTAVTKDCLHLDVRPASIVFTCADGGFFVRRLQWRAWHQRAAFAHGVFHRNDCDPSCAGGTVAVTTGTLRLTHRRRCEGWNRYVFRRAVMVFDAPLLGRNRETFDLFCPFRDP